MRANDWELAISDLNLAEALREHARWMPPGEIHESDDLLLTASSSRFPVGLWNCAMLLGAPASDAEACRERVGRWFAERNRGGTLYLRAHADGDLVAACERAGWKRVGDSPAMLLDERVPVRALPEGAECRVVTAASAAAFADVMATAYVSLDTPEALT